MSNVYGAGLTPELIASRQRVSQEIMRTAHPAGSAYQPMATGMTAGPAMQPVIPDNSNSPLMPLTDPLTPPIDYSVKPPRDASAGERSVSTHPTTGAGQEDVRPYVRKLFG